ncbi:hypothetical protein [Polaribacter sp. P097]|uniref:hypothetical protein n=1 Tax=Polaribacter sp. P097 TaxID=3117398 RepID=UPI002FE37B34
MKSQQISLDNLLIAYIYKELSAMLEKNMPSPNFLFPTTSIAFSLTNSNLLLTNSN